MLVVTYHTHTHTKDVNKLTFTYSNSEISLSTVAQEKSTHDDNKGHDIVKTLVNTPAQYSH